jgi:hypothetical protein
MWPRHVHRSVTRRILQAFGDRRHIAELGGFHRRAKRETFAVGGHAHRAVERAEVRVTVPFGTGDTTFTVNSATTLP